MNEYETVAIINPDLSADLTKKLADKLAESITKGGGELIEKQNWGKRRLAYRVKKSTLGVYFFAHYVGGGETVKSLERQLRFDDNVYKYLTVRQAVGVDAGLVRAKKISSPFEPRTQSPGGAEADGANPSDGRRFSRRDDRGGMEKSYG